MTTMEIIKTLIKKIFYKSYRLAVWTAKGRIYNFAADSKDEVVAQAIEFCSDLNRCTWTLYKTGRFGLPEREIKRSNN